MKRVQKRVIRKRKSIFSLWLVTLFVAYQMSISMFTHVHYDNGVMITHSHPFQGKHSHQSSSTLLIDRLSTFHSLEVGCFFDLTPFRHELCVLKAGCEVPVLAGTHWLAALLRAPPAVV